MFENVVACIVAAGFGFDIIMITILHRIKNVEPNYLSKIIYFIAVAVVVFSELCTL